MSSLIDLRWMKYETRYLQRVVRAIHEELEATTDSENAELRIIVMHLEKIIESRKPSSREVHGGQAFSAGF